MGQLQEIGNVEIVKHYISLYEGAFLFRALEKYSTNAIKAKASSPKKERGRLLELSVGSVLNRLPGELYYWRDGKHEVDFVYVLGKSVYAIEVKSSRPRGTRGLTEFRKRFAKSKAVVVREEDFLRFVADPQSFLSSAL